MNEMPANEDGDIEKLPKSFWNDEHGATEKARQKLGKLHKLELLAFANAACAELAKQNGLRFEPMSFDDLTDELKTVGQHPYVSLAEIQRPA